MARVHYIGDEATAAGYRLAGADVRVPAAQELADTFRRALESDADLVLLSAQHAAALPEEELDAALLGDRPLVAIVPDVAREVRLALGIEEP